MTRELPVLLRPHVVPMDSYNKMNPIEKVCFKFSQGIGFVIVFGWHLTNCTPMHWFTKPNFGCTRGSELVSSSSDEPVQKDTQ